MIAQGSINEVLSRADVVEIIGQFVRLKKRGANYIANCPFHNEKTPSFYVSGSKGIYKCFGCGKGGNVVTFIQDHEKLSYPESIRWLADYYKIEIEESERTPQQQQQQLAEESLRIINDFAAQYFNDILLNNEEGQTIGLSYFKQRGFRKDIIEKFRLGYCLESQNEFFKAALAKAYNPELIEKAGLIRRRNDQWYDMYHGRVIFPIQSMTGRILGFGARILKSNDKAPKYINTPENELYIKSRVLYGMFQSRQSIGRQDECFLVEGYTDVISLHQGGVDNVVSSSGTSLTEDQLRLIGQLTKNLTILYDGDAAGVKAALRGMDMALSQSFNVQLVLLPQGEDPDSFIQKSGAAAFHEYVAAHKQSVIGFRLEVGLKEVGTDPVKKSKLVNEIAESISRINKTEDFALQEHYIRESARILQVDETGLVNLVNKYIRDRLDTERRRDKQAEERTPLPTLPVEGEPQPVDNSTQVHDDQEWQLLRVLLEHGAKAWEEAPNVAHMVHGRIDPDLIENVQARQLYDMIFAHWQQHQALPDMSFFTNHTDPAIQQRMVSLLQLRNEISHNWADKYHIETMHGDLNYINDVESTLSYFELKKIKIMQQDIMQRISTESDIQKQIALIQKHLELKTHENDILKKSGTVIIKMAHNK
jgi:DNA primase